ARAVGGGQVQLAGETAGSLVVVGGHGVRTTGLVLGGAAAVVGGPGGRTRRARGDRPGRGLRLGLAGAGGLLGGLALFLVALAPGHRGAVAVGLGQARLLGQIALAGLLQLAQHLGALIVHRAGGGLGGRRVGLVDVGALLADLDGDGGLAAAAADGQFLHLAPRQGDLLRRSDLLGRSRRALAVGAAQEAEELDLLGT